MRRSHLAVFGGLCVVGLACAAGTEDTGAIGPGAAGGTGGAGGTPRECVAETCNGLDDDCDGFVDEDCPCDEGDEQTCYTGNPVTVDVGVCRRGTQECVSGAWGPCVDEVGPSGEVCDGQDNDCDGVIDENCGGGGAGGMYAQAEFPVGHSPAPDIQEVPFPRGIGESVTLQVDFEWRDHAGRPPPFDLSVKLSGSVESLVQVFSFQGRPLVRIGPRAELIRPNRPYRIEVSRSDDSVRWRVVRVADQSVVLSSPAGESVVATRDTVELVTPQTGSRVSLGRLRITR